MLAAMHAIDPHPEEGIRQQATAAVPAEADMDKEHGNQGEDGVETNSIEACKDGGAYTRVSANNTQHKICQTVNKSKDCKQ